jgi:single-strand DNA-binding protein
MNKALILGHLGKDPEIRNFESGKVANFSLATTERRKDKDGNRIDETEWHKVSAWGKLAEIIEKYVKKGDQILIEGKIVTRSYEKEGEKRYSTEIIAREMKMISGKKPSNSQPTSVENQSPQNDLPF